MRGVKCRHCGVDFSVAVCSLPTAGHFAMHDEAADSLKFTWACAKLSFSGCTMRVNIGEVCSQNLTSGRSSIVYGMDGRRENDSCCGCARQTGRVIVIALVINWQRLGCAVCTAQPRAAVWLAPSIFARGSVYALCMQDAEVLYAWLASMRLDHLSELFLQAGYDMFTISRMTPEVPSRLATNFLQISAHTSDTTSFCPRRNF